MVSSRGILQAIGTTRGFIGEEKVESELVIVGSSLQALGYILQIIASNYDDGEEKERIKVNYLIK